jgi:hypothetical protein
MAHRFPPALLSVAPAPYRHSERSEESPQCGYHTWVLGKRRFLAALEMTAQNREMTAKKQRNDGAKQGNDGKKKGNDSSNNQPK